MLSLLRLPMMMMVMIFNDMNGDDHRCHEHCDGDNGLC